MIHSIFLDILCCAIWSSCHYKELYSNIQLSLALYCIIEYCTVLNCAVLYFTVLCCTVLYCTVLNCAVLYWAVLHLFFVLPFPSCLPVHYSTTDRQVGSKAVQQGNILLLCVLFSKQKICGAFVCIQIFFNFK